MYVLELCDNHDDKLIIKSISDYRDEDFYYHDNS